MNLTRKCRVITITLVLSGLLSQPSLAADGWKGVGKVLSVQPEMFLKGDDEGGYPILIETNIPSTDCGGSTWAIRSNYDDGGRMYSAALTALVANSSVELYQSSCYRVGGKHYPRVGGIKVLK